VSGRSPSPWRVVVISGAIAVLASAMTPVYGAAPAKKSPLAKQWKQERTKRLGNIGGGSLGMLSLQWTISAMLRP
jgi:hypothetical protein